jgi:NIPSNAP protein
VPRSGAGGSGASVAQLREYTVKPGEIEAWVAEWREKIAPLRQRHGFAIVGAWTVDGSDQFVWIIRYRGPKTWAEADRDYHESPERKAMDPDPARHLAATSMRFICDVTEEHEAARG